MSRAATDVNMILCSQCKCIDPDNQGPAGPKCGAPNYKGDGVCDDDNNNKGCAYDGGDCCPKTTTAKGGKVDKSYCKQVWVVTQCSAVDGVTSLVYG